MDEVGKSVILGDHDSCSHRLFVKPMKDNRNFVRTVKLIPATFARGSAARATSRALAHQQDLMEVK